MEVKRKALPDEEIKLAQKLCVEMGECSATYHIVTQLQEIERLKEELFLRGDELRQMTNCRDDLQRLVAQREAEKASLQARSLHDFCNLLMNSIKDTLPTDDPREVLRCLAVAVNETGPKELGVGECDCKRVDCPYK